MHFEGDALLSTTMTTAPIHYQQHDERLSYSNLEVVNHAVPAHHQPIIGYDVENQPYNYVPYSEALKGMHTNTAVSNDAMAAEHYANPPPFARTTSTEEKIVSPGDSAAPEVAPHDYAHHHGHSVPPHYEHEAPLICGVRRRTFWIVLGVVVAVVIVAAVGGGVGGYYANRPQSDTSTSASSTNTTNTDNSSPSPSSPPPPVTYRMNIAALRWNDPTSHYRVYVQPTYKNETQILESAWDSDTQKWALSAITDLTTAMTIKPNAPLTAAAGIPHSDPVGERLVRNVYYPLVDNRMVERTTPYKGQVGKWGDENFSDLEYRFSDDSSMAVYWWQDMNPRYFILAMFYQEFGADSLTITSYSEGGPSVNVSKGHDWEVSTKGVSIQDGSPLALAPRSDGPLAMLYMADSDGNMNQLQVDLETGNFGPVTGTNYKLAPHHPLCVSTEDNRNYFTGGTLPSCAGTDPLTHLILFAGEDRQDLKLVSWNCSSGFVDATNRIAGLLKPKRTYLSVATTSASNLTFVDQRVYVLYDEGKGPIMEEWQIPDSGRSIPTPGQGGNWKLRGEVPIAFGS